MARKTTELKTCPICEGVSVNAPKSVRTEWRERFFDAEQKGEKIFKQVRKAILKEMDAFRPCAFCNEGRVPVTGRDRR